MFYLSLKLVFQVLTLCDIIQKNFTQGRGSKGLLRILSCRHLYEFGVWYGMEWNGIVSLMLALTIFYS